MNGLFITGTDTDVGKTWVTARLARALRDRGLDVGVWKPVQAGCMWGEPDADSHILKTISGVEETEEEICPVSLRAPLAPMVAAHLEDRTVTVADLISHWRLISDRHPLWLVEGAGGLAVPVSQGELIVDVAAALGFRLLLIAKSGLGTINHTLLSVDYACSRGLRWSGIIVNRYPKLPESVQSFDDLNSETTLTNSLSTNPLCITEFSQIPILGRIPEVSEPDTADDIEQYINVDHLVHELAGE